MPYPLVTFDFGLFLRYLFPGIISVYEEQIDDTGL
jgi:hypothetical protein